MGRPPKSAASSSSLSRRIAVVVDIDMTIKTPKVIWAHEYPILELMHGEGKVKQIEAEDLDDGYSDKPTREILPHNKTQDKLQRPSVANGLGYVFIDDPRSEYARLQDAYGRLPNENIFAVEKAYGRFAEGRFESLIGTPTLTDLPDGQLRQLLNDYGHAPEDSRKDMSDAEKTAASAARQKFIKSTREDLLKMCKEADIPVGQELETA